MSEQLSLPKQTLHIVTLYQSRVVTQVTFEVAQVTFFQDAANVSQ